MFWFKLPILVQTQVIHIPDWALGPTVVTVDLSYAHEIEVCLIVVFQLKRMHA